MCCTTSIVSQEIFLTRLPDSEYSVAYLDMPQHKYSSITQYRSHKSNTNQCKTKGIIRESTSTVKMK